MSCIDGGSENNTDIGDIYWGEGGREIHIEQSGILDGLRILDGLNSLCQWLGGTDWEERENNDPTVHELN